MTDPFEEFEFKPLTEGLGFQKKAEKIKSDIKATNLIQEKISRPSADVAPKAFLSSELDDEPLVSNSVLSHPSSGLSVPSTTRPASQSISDLIASLPPSLDFIDDKRSEDRSSAGAKNSSGGFLNNVTSSLSSFDSTEDTPSRPQIFQPLARDEYKPSGPTIGSLLPTPGTKSTVSASPSMPAIPTPMSPMISGAPAASPYREKLDESFARAFPHAEKTKREVTEEPAVEPLSPVSAHFGAAILDAMVAAGVSTILLVCVLAITRINLIGLLTNSATDGATRLHLGFLFLATLQIYMLAARCFFGASLGEWAFDLQIGTNEQQKRAFYPLQVLWRMVLVTGTGLLLFPFLSLLFRRDLAKYLTGVQLYRRQ